MNYVFTALFALLCGIGVGCALEEKLVTERTILQMRAQAIERGFAEWQVDPKTGTTTFQWREGQNISQQRESLVAPSPRVETSGAK